MESEKMKFTKEQIDILIPNLDISISEDEYLDMLKHSNDGIDFGEIMNYSSEEEHELDEYLNGFMQAT
jgi:hypothetical protein